VSYLLDTNVASEIRKPRPDSCVAAWFDQADSGELYLSVLIVGEIRQGIEADRVLPISARVAECWGRLEAAQALPAIDGLLAAAAIEHDLTLVTRESRTLAASGARRLDSWRA